MRLLLDTHTLLWWLNDDPLTTEARDAIGDPATFVAVSSVSLWEISIKTAIGKLSIDGDLTTALADSGFDELPIRWLHAAAVRDLEPLHRDPFDRMLVAQARLEGLTVVTRDPTIPRYGVPVLAA